MIKQIYLEIGFILYIKKIIEMIYRVLHHSISFIGHAWLFLSI
jgi:hypothetical protein